MPWERERTLQETRGILLFWIAIEHLKEVNKGNDVAAIKTAIEDAQKAFYPVAEKLYQQANPQGDAGCGGDCGSCGNDGVVDADYETVD